MRITDGELVAKIDLGGSIDDLMVDTKERLYLVSGELSTLSVIDTHIQENTARLEAIGNYPAYLLIPER